MATSSNVPSSRKTSTEIETQRKIALMMFKLDTFFPFVLCGEGECPYLNGIVCLNPDAYVDKRNERFHVIRKGECPWNQKKRHGEES